MHVLRPLRLVAIKRLVAGGVGNDLVSGDRVEVSPGGREDAGWYRRVLVVGVGRHRGRAVHAAGARWNCR